MTTPEPNAPPPVRTHRRPPRAAAAARLLHWLGAGLAVAALAVGGGAALAAPTTLALADLPSFALGQIAAAEDYFAAEGLDLKVLRCVNGRACLQALAEGKAQLATVADTPLVMAAHSGVPYQIVATMGSSGRDNSIVARSDRGIRTPADLKGKRIGFVRGTTGHYFTDSYLLFHGIPRSSVTLVPLDPATAPEQLARGEVDAAGLYQPHGPRAQALLGDKGVLLPSPRLYAVTINLISQPGVPEDTVLRVLRALARAERLMEREPQRARALLAARLRLDASTIAEFWGVYDFRLVLEQSLLTTLEAQSRWALREGLVPPGPAPDFLERIRPGPLKALDPRAVTLVN